MCITAQNILVCEFLYSIPDTNMLTVSANLNVWKRGDFSCNFMIVGKIKGYFSLAYSITIFTSLCLGPFLGNNIDKKWTWSYILSFVCCFCHLFWWDQNKWQKQHKKILPIIFSAIVHTSLSYPGLLLLPVLKKAGTLQIIHIHCIFKLVKLYSAQVWILYFLLQDQFCLFISQIWRRIGQLLIWIFSVPNLSIYVPQFWSFHMFLVKN